MAEEYVVADMNIALRIFNSGRKIDGVAYWERLLIECVIPEIEKPAEFVRGRDPEQFLKDVRYIQNEAGRMVKEVRRAQLFGNPGDTGYGLEVPRE